MNPTRVVRTVDVEAITVYLLVSVFLNLKATHHISCVLYPKIPAIHPPVVQTHSAPYSQTVIQSAHVYRATLSPRIPFVVASSRRTLVIRVHAQLAPYAMPPETQCVRARNHSSVIHSANANRHLWMSRYAILVRVETVQTVTYQVVVSTVFVRQVLTEILM